MADAREEPYPDVLIGGGFFEPPEPPAPPAPVPVSGTAGRKWPGRPRMPGPAAWRRGRVLTALTALVAVLLTSHALVPQAGGNLGSLWETVLPWAGLTVPPALAAALIRRSAPAVTAALLLAALWLAMFGHLFAGPASGVSPNLTVVTHNVGAANPDPVPTARTLLAADPDLVALEEVTDEALPSYRSVLGRRLRYSVRVGTVALWSRYPITGSRRVVIDPGWSRSLRAEIRGPDGPLAVYVVHLASVRVGSSGFTTGRRDGTVPALAAELDREPLKKVLLMGDLNGSTEDRRLRPVVSRLTSVQDSAGAGFGFSWPARLPVVRLDQILTRGVTPARAWTLPATGSDHRPVAAALRT